MLKYDSMHGPYIGEVSFSGSDLVIDGKKIMSYSEKCVFPHLASFTLDKSQVASGLGAAPSWSET